MEPGSAPTTTKLPRYAWVGAWMLAFLTGFVNVVTLLGFENQAVSHMTGTSTMLAAAFAKVDVANILELVGVILAFVGGSIISGFIIEDGKLKLGHRYSVALFLEAVLLLVAIPLLYLNGAPGVFAAAAACGLQNAMVTTYSGAVVRTTHLSGIFTDLGILFGHLLRGLQVDKLRIWLYLCIISAFVGGGIAGAFGFEEFSYRSLIFPAAVNALAAVVFSAYVFHRGHSY